MNTLGEFRTAMCTVRRYLNPNGWCFPASLCLCLFFSFCTVPCAAFADEGDAEVVQVGVQWRQTYWLDASFSNQVEGSDRFDGRGDFTESTVKLTVDPSVYRTVDATVRVFDKWYVQGFIASDEETEQVREWMARLGYDDWTLHVERGNVAGKIEVDPLLTGGATLSSPTSFDGDYLAVSVYTRHESAFGSELGAGYARYNFPTTMSLFDATPSEGAAYIGHEPDMSIVDANTTFHTLGVWVSVDALRESMLSRGRSPLWEVRGDAGTLAAGFSGSVLLGLSRIDPGRDAIKSVKSQLDVSEVRSESLWGLTYHATYEFCVFTHTELMGLRLGAKAGYQGRIHSILEFGLFDDVSEAGSVSSAGEVDAATDPDSIDVFQVLHGPVVGVHAMW